MPVLRRWAGMVGNFSRRHFTVKTDKLLAVSSLARRLVADVPARYGSQDSRPEARASGKSRMSTGANYCAGIWGGEALADLSQLSWYCVGAMESHDDKSPGPTFLCPENYIAPSFSWASVNPKYWSSRIRFEFYDEPDPDHTGTSRVLTVNIVPTLATNPFGRVLRGSLSVQGPVLKCKVQYDRYKREAIELHPQFNFSLPEGASLKVSIVRTDCSLRPLTTQSGIRSVKRSLCFENFDNADALMLILHYRCGFGSYYGTYSNAVPYRSTLRTWYFCLLLATGGPPGMYQRIGFAILFQSYNFEKDFEEMAPED